MKTKKKHVLLITVDQWSANYLGCAGNEEILTPSLDELARYGIRYPNAVSNTPVCIPARRELMLGVGSRTHGDRKFNELLPLPQDIPSMAQVFRNNGYQAYCVGKLHVFPQRDRIGFDDVLLHEEGRHKEGMAQDDYERFLSRSGYAGLEMGHGMCNNNYFSRPFHLPEEYNVTNWAVKNMCEYIIRRDTTKPAFWYLSFAAPHPPLVPPKDYLDFYENMEFSEPKCGEWTNQSSDVLPYAYNYYRNLYNMDNKTASDIAKKAYYASCTYIDHQLRLVIGTLREQGILDDTVILFTADHGEMLGSNHLYGKFLMYENSVKIPFILSPASDSKMQCSRIDERLVELKDVMPTLLTLAGLEVPDYVEGRSLTEEWEREYSYGELWEDDRATRMILTKEWKLIYYCTGNIFQLFNVKNDPYELFDLSEKEEYQEIKAQLIEKLIDNLYGQDLELIKDGRLVGLPFKKYDFNASLADGNKLFQGRDMLLQRGLR
ncbi:sulfatase-like hydrolase/transferase [Lacrimispora sp.]|uniref:sulfatase-like hydrolase/transferase n=1 Tax=Lacrimispora sp. TaxID=2719234 RepID=UPI003460EED2